MQRCDAVVLATRPLGEADLLVVLFTAEHGKIRAAAKSARKSKRRFAGGIGGGALGTAELQPRAQGLWRLDSFVPRLDHAALGRDLGRFAHVAYLCELTDVLLDGQNPEPALYVALVQALVDELAGAPDAMILRRYELALLQALGHLPALAECCVCGGEIASPAVPFDAARGGALCPTHAGLAGLLDREVLVTAQTLLAGAAIPAAGPELRRSLRDLTTAQLRPLLHRPLRSVAFFAQIAAASEVDGGR